MVSGISGATYLVRSALAEGSRDFPAPLVSTDTEEVDYYYASRALHRMTDCSRRKKEKNFSTSYPGFIVSSLATFGLWKGKAPWGWIVLVGATAALGGVLTWLDAWDRFKPKSSDKLWGEYKSAETIEERLELIEKLRNKGDDDAVKHLRSVFTKPGVSKKELVEVESALDAILAERGYWEQLGVERMDGDKTSFNVQETRFFEEIVKFPTTNNVQRFLKIPKRLDEILHPPHGKEYSFVDVNLAIMARKNPITVVEALLKAEAIKRAEYTIERMWELLPASTPGPQKNLRDGWATPAQIHYSAGRVAETREQQQDAIASFRTSLEYDSKFPEAHFHLARLYAEQNAGTQAVRHFSEAVRLAEDPAGMFDRAIFSALQSRSPNVALELLLEISWRDFVDFPMVPLYEGYRSHLKGDYREAIPQYEAFLEKNPGHARARFSLGMSYLRLGREADRKEAVKILGPLAGELRRSPEPTTPEDRSFHASVFHGAGMAFLKDDPTMAEAYFGRAVELYPSKEGKARLYNDLGHLYGSVLGNQKKALEFYDRALTLYPYSLAMLNRTYALRKLGRGEEAKENLIRFVGSEQHLADFQSSAYAELSDIELVRKQWKEALAFAKKSVALDETNVLGYWNMMEAYTGMRRYEEAIEACDKAIQQRTLHPQDKEEEIAELMEIRRRLEEKRQKGEGK